MWELLQNASDLGNEISAEFEITDTQLIFRHNGKLFGLDEAYNLIMPDSSKDEEFLRSKEENPPIGQFGTGFISTHILSKKIRINGIVEDSEENEFFSFSFLLDRTERKSKDFLIDSIKNSEKEYSKSLTKLSNFKPSEFDTEFIYDLTDTYNSIDGTETIDEGIKTLDDLLPFVFSFRPQLKKVRVKDYRKNKSEIKCYLRELIESDINQIEIIQTTCHLNGILQNKTQIATVKKGKSTIAVKVKNINNTRFDIQEYPSYSPVLYCAFPMIGSTQFNFPVVIHSDFFVPNRERDGIEISQYDEENRERLMEAKNAFLILTDVVEKHKWDSSYHFFNLSTLDFSNDEIHKWYKTEIFNPILKTLRESNIVKVSNDIQKNHSSFTKMYFPYIDKRKTNKYELLSKLYRFANNLFSDELPIESQYQKWYDIINFEIFDQEKLDLEQLLANISQQNKKLTDFKTNYNYTNEVSIEYLKNLVIFVISCEEKNELNNYNLIPNQQGDFCFLKKLKTDFIAHKAIDQEYQEKLKLIGAELTKEDCKDFLLHKDFETIQDLMDPDDKYELSELCTKIDDELRNFDGNFNDDEFLLILKDLFHWHTNCGLSEESLIKLFPYFSQNKSQLYLNTKTPEELEYAFDIEISGKSQVLARIAKSNLTNEELEIVAENPGLV
ncbi:MAG: ATP-binding protein, partial [Ignavibacteriae bacterium]|nr:ATP-binding protein [Ignavibacteriota bacterium]